MKKIVVKEEYLPSIKNEKKFINAIQLGRIVGAIRYNIIIHAKIIDDEKVNTSLQLYLLLNHGALVYEGIKKFNENKSDFENLNYYKGNLDMIGKILNEANEKNSFTNTVLKRIRNKVAFHFDKKVIKKVIEQFVDDSLKENKEVVLISGKSELARDTTYQLADNMNINYVLKLINEEEKSIREKVEILSKNLFGLSGLFCDILDQLIPDLIEDYCELKEEKE